MFSRYLHCFKLVFFCSFGDVEYSLIISGSWLGRDKTPSKSHLPRKMAKSVKKKRKKIQYMLTRLSWRFKGVRHNLILNLFILYFYTLRMLTTLRFAPRLCAPTFLSNRLMHSFHYWAQGNSGFSECFHVGAHFFSYSLIEIDSNLIYGNNLILLLPTNGNPSGLGGLRAQARAPLREACNAARQWCFAGEHGCFHCSRTERTHYLMWTRGSSVLCPSTCCCCCCRG